MASGVDRDNVSPGEVRRRNPSGDPRAIKGLVNARSLARQYSSFEVPSDAEIKRLKPGDGVKLARNGERFWVKVTGYIGRQWHGTVDNDLIRNPDLEPGDPIFFMKKNIYDVRYRK